MWYSEKDMGLDMRATGLENHHHSLQTALPCGGILGHTAHEK